MVRPVMILHQNNEDCLDGWQIAARTEKSCDKEEPQSYSPRTKPDTTHLRLVTQKKPTKSKLHHKTGHRSSRGNQSIYD